MSLSEIPHPSGFQLVPEKWREPLVESILHAIDNIDEREQLESALWAILILHSPSFPQVYECQACGRLALFIDPSADEVNQWYLPELDDQFRVTRSV